MRKFHTHESSPFISPTLSSNIRSSSRKRTAMQASESNPSKSSERSDISSANVTTSYTPPLREYIPHYTPTEQDVKRPRHSYEKVDYRYSPGATGARPSFDPYQPPTLPSINPFYSHPAPQQYIPTTMPSLPSYSQHARAVPPVPPIAGHSPEHHNVPLVHHASLSQQPQQQHHHHQQFSAEQSQHQSQVEHQQKYWHTDYRFLPP